MADLKQAFCRCFAGLSRLSYCKTGLLQFFHDTKSSAGLLEDCSSAVFLQIVGLKNIQHQLACYTDFVYIWLACCAFDWNDRPTENRLISMHKIENERTLIGTSRQTLQHTLWNESEGIAEAETAIPASAFVAGLSSQCLKKYHRYRLLRVCLCVCVRDSVCVWVHVWVWGRERICVSRSHRMPCHGTNIGLFPLLFKRSTVRVYTHTYTLVGLTQSSRSRSKHKKVQTNAYLF